MGSYSENPITPLLTSVDELEQVALLEPQANSSHLDDFTLDPAGEQLFVAGVSTGNILQFSAEGLRSTKEPASIVISGVASPTSARWGCVDDPSSGLSSSLLFVTEGGNILPWVTNRRVLVIRNITGANPERA